MPSKNKKWNIILWLGIFFGVLVVCVIIFIVRTHQTKKVSEPQSAEVNTSDQSPDTGTVPPEGDQPALNSTADSATGNTSSPNTSTTVNPDSSAIQSDNQGTVSGTTDYSHVINGNFDER